MTMWQKTKFKGLEIEDSIFEIVLPPHDRQRVLEEQSEELKRKLLETESRLKHIEENEKKLKSENNKIQELLKAAGDVAVNENAPPAKVEKNKEIPEKKKQTQTEPHQDALVLEEAVYSEVVEMILDDFGKVQGTYGS